MYGLKPGLALPLNLKGPAWEAPAPVKFVITGEVSTIYKKGGKVRKVHLLLVLPDLEAAQQLSQRLGRLGNVASDGRPPTAHRPPSIARSRRAATPRSPGSGSGEASTRSQALSQGLS